MFENSKFHFLDIPGQKLCTKSFKILVLAFLEVVRLFRIKKLGEVSRKLQNDFCLERASQSFTRRAGRTNYIRYGIMLLMILYILTIELPYATLTIN